MTDHDGNLLIVLKKCAVGQFWCYCVLDFLLNKDFYVCIGYVYNKLYLNTFYAKNFMFA